MTTSVKRISPCPPGFTDHIYKVEKGVEIPLRLWRAKGTKSGSGGKRPWLFWAHGGGFIGGKHVIPNAWVVPAFQLLDYHIVSIAYRYMPHVQMPGILSDVQDAFAWCRSNLPSLVGGHDAIDIDAYVAAGDSAGGTISTLCGIYLSPRPRVVIDVFGVTDMTDSHFYRVPDADRLALPYLQDLDPGRDRAEQKRFLEDRDESKAEVICPWDWELEMDLKDLEVFWGVRAEEYDLGDSGKYRYRMDLNKYLNRTASRMTLLLQREKYEEDAEGEAEFWRDVKEKWSVEHVVKERKDAEYPPTFFLHGTGDTAVPVEQSYRLEEVLNGLGVPTGSAYCEGGEHCFENKIEGPEDDGWEEYIAPCMAFVERHIGDRA